MAPTVAIIGAGFGGLCMAIQLERAGIRSYTIFEKAAGVGGTWRDNTYPGAGCDIPSHLYSFSFEKYASWTRRYPEQPEILAYLEHVRRQVRPAPADPVQHRGHGRLLRRVAGRWRVRTTAGEELFDVVVSGVGQLNRPHLPDIPGMPTSRARPSTPPAGTTPTT